VQQYFIARVSICIFTAAKVMILNRKFLKFEIDLDFVLIAVTTSLKDYIYPGGNHVLFSLYHYNWETTETDFYFIANKGSEGYLVPEMKKADYFLMIKNYIDETDLDGLIVSLNKIPEIVTAVKIDPKKIKSRENLLF